MEAFSDGVFAIAITLLVLDVAVHPPGTPLEQVLHAWPAYVAYVVSFLDDRCCLARPHRLDRPARAVRFDLPRSNLLVLLVVGFLLFLTRLVADALQHTDAERVAVTVYGLTLLAIRVWGTGLAEYARREHLDSPPGEGEEPLGEQRKLRPSSSGTRPRSSSGCSCRERRWHCISPSWIYLVVPFREEQYVIEPVKKKNHHYHRHVLLHETEG